MPPKEVPVNRDLNALAPAVRVAAQRVLAGMKDAGFNAKFDAMDADAWCSTPAEFADMLRADWTKWGEAVKFSGATTE